MEFRTVGRIYKLDKADLEKAANAAFSVLGLEKEKGSIELKLTSVDEIHRLNKHYRDIDKPTDVLSFNISDSPLTGQIFICYNILVAQASELGRSLSDEASLLLVHGILHISGLDHEIETDAVEMERLEAEILNIVGVKR